MGGNGGSECEESTRKLSEQPSNAEGEPRDNWRVPLEKIIIMWTTNKVRSGRSSARKQAAIPPLEIGRGIC